MRLPASLLAASSRRYLTRHPWQSGLSILGVALGVAVVVAIRLTNASALAAFALSTEAVVGRTTHQVIGGPSGVPEELYVRLRTSGLEVPAAPVVELPVTLSPGRRARLIGLDPLAERAFRTALSGSAGSRIDLGAFLAEPATALLAASTARELGIAPGDTFEVQLGARRQTLRLLGSVTAADERQQEAMADWVVVDLATAQEVADTPGFLTRIDLILPAPPGDAAVLERISALLPPGTSLVTAAARSRSMLGLSRAFRFNLTALSLLALLCGAFLVYNTMTFSVVQRRPLLGLLRALGVSRRELLRLVLGEAALLGTLAVALGLPLGIVLARGLVRQVARTVNDFYFAVTVERVAIEPAALVLAAALGLGASLLAALPPALEAVSTPPRAVLLRSVLEERLRRTLPRLGLAAAVGTVLGALLLAWPGRQLVPAFLGLLALVLACACLAPLVTVLVSRLGRAVLARPFGLIGKLAASRLAGSLSRTGVAIASLMIAVSVTVGVGLMIASFRGSLASWLDGTLAADVYIGGGGPAYPPPIDDQLVARLRAVPDVVTLKTLLSIPLEMPAGPIELQAVGSPDQATADRGRLDLTAGDPAAVWPAWQRGEGVLVSEPLAYRRQLKPGDRLSLPTDQGARELPILGVFSDYSPGPGAVMIERTAFEQLWRARGYSALALFLAPGSDGATTVAALKKAAGPAAAMLEMRSNRALKDNSLAIFDRTFRITNVLRLLAGIVAFLGVLAALLALELERARELALLRALGLTPRGLSQLVMLETGLMGLVAGVLAVPVGTLMAAVMVYVINRRSFGWSLELTLHPAVLASAVVLALAAALLAGAYPAWKMARLAPAAGLREE